MFNLKITVDKREWKSLETSMGRYIRVLSDMTPTMKELGNTIRKVEITKNFDVGGRPQRWTPRVKDASGNEPAHALLKQSGRLFESVTGKESESIKGSSGKWDLSISTGLHYSNTHSQNEEWGSKKVINSRSFDGMRFKWIPRTGTNWQLQQVTIPSRPFMYYSPEVPLDVVYRSVEKRMKLKVTKR